jgi:hypothetical protein
MVQQNSNIFGAGVCGGELAFPPADAPSEIGSQLTQIE